MLRSIALRYRDGILAGENNTGDMAERYLGSYVRHMHHIYRVLNDAVLWELEQNGETCQCTCPSCGHGICVCSQAPRKTLSDIWSEAGPIADDDSVYIHRPRLGSPAEQAGLSAGDQILELTEMPWKPTSCFKASSASIKQVI
jgi:membrane-associated protease RseP (regulator of RpoE activity)